MLAAFSPPPPLALPFLPCPHIPPQAPPFPSDYIFKVYLYSCKKYGYYIHSGSNMYSTQSKQENHLDQFSFRECIMDL